MYVGLACYRRHVSTEEKRKKKMEVENPLENKHLILRVPAMEYVPAARRL